MVEPRRVVAFPWDAFSAVELENPFAHVVEEVSVVGDGNHSALILLQVLFEPVDAFGVEVVCRFVEQQHVRLLQQKAAESHAATLTS